MTIRSEYSIPFRRPAVSLAAGLLLMGIYPAAAQRGRPAPYGIRIPAGPSRLLGMAVQPTHIEGGKVVQLKVALNRPAPKGGTLVFMKSPDRKLVRVPAQFRVPQGQTMLQMSLATRPVEHETRLEVKAWDQITAPMVDRKGPRPLKYRNVPTPVRHTFITLLPPQQGQTGGNAPPGAPPAR